LSSQDSSVLINALIKAGGILGLNKTDTLHVVGVESDCIGINRDSGAGEKAAQLIRIYISLYSFMGGNQKQMRFWMHTDNKGASGIPAQQVKTESGLFQVVGYLEDIKNSSVS